MNSSLEKIWVLHLNFFFRPGATVLKLYIHVAKSVNESLNNLHNDMNVQFDINKYRSIV